MWQLNTFMKIETRGSARSPRLSSAGGTAWMILLTRPSAGATTSPSRVGVTRSGSRKNSAHQTVSTVPIQPSGDHSQNKSRLASANMPMNGSPSRWTGTICRRIEVIIDMLTRLPHSATLFRCMGPRHGYVLDRRLLDWRRVAIGGDHFIADFGELLASRFRFALAVPHAGIEPALCKQHLMGSALHDRALIQHNDLISGHDGREPMRDHERGAVARHPVERVLDLLLGMAVER